MQNPIVNSNKEMQSEAPPTIAGRRIYKVSELTREIRLLLEDRFPLVWVEGEVSNFKKHSSGHIYMTLKDANAQLAAVFFARQNQFLKFELKDGLSVIAIGRVSVYDVRGNYQLYVERVEPKGLGALQLAFLQLKEKLEKEGLFDPARKKPIPYYPKRIGIVTSPTGAALQDMLKVFQKTPAGLHVQIFPVRVQGEGSAEEVAGAIDELNRKGGLDVIIVGRGGGSLEDLWAFNEEVVARAIFRSKIPVVSAVGHEIDWTISDLVADLRAHTPTAAAEHLVFHWNDSQMKLIEYRKRMQNAVTVLFKGKLELLSQLKQSYAFRQPLSTIKQIAQQVDELMRRLDGSVESVFDRQEQLFHALAGKLEVLSPLGVLSRGYSIAFNQKGKVVRNARDVQTGESIRTRLSKGVIESKVTEISEA